MLFILREVTPPTIITAGETSSAFFVSSAIFFKGALTHFSSGKVPFEITAEGVKGSLPSEISRFAISSMLFKPIRKTRVPSKRAKTPKSSEKAIFPSFV